MAWQTFMNRFRRLLLVAVFDDGDALDELHHEVRAARLGGAGVEDLGDVGVVHQRQRLPLGLETCDDLPRVHAQLDHLQGHAALYRLPLLCRPHRPKAAFAKLLDELVATDQRSGFLQGCAIS
jgi:hypothetical protein